MKNYKVIIDFAGHPEIYEVEAENEHDARKEALKMAIEDLSIVCVSCE